METSRISPVRWAEFFDSFSRQHDCWLVAVEVIGAEIGAQFEGQQLRLRGISCNDPQGSGISVMLETLEGEHLTHAIVGPTDVWLEQTSDGADAAIQIEAADQTRTLVRFRSPLRPDAVDGVMSADAVR